MTRLTKLQQLLVSHIKQQGGDHVYLSRAWTPPSESERVNLSLRALVRRGVGGREPVPARPRPPRRAARSEGFVLLPRGRQKIISRQLP